ncbi:Dihydroorotate dehydrogenase [Caenispirillum salinarum AK4]|uniref:Dihydroorotate dehydrogenase (quinone) n=1 Tax=Caenispirillum salinarum AK4 TaxID=1238182 RepID=K9HVQ1_9PROT|nr:quinone-dependent dihydroorotate dehydrogenase [Caenispirillum salinarum]EKV32316.1 Dihydroorotate dehydrogenase [Caenispirillum salinarum AK4]
MLNLYSLAWPLVRRMDPETAHRMAVAALARGLVPGVPHADPPALRTRVWGRDFANPIGLAAGFDKHAECPDALARLGFGFVEVGGVTPRPQPGNPRPRVFRLEEDGAVINRFGLNSDGMEAVAARLAARRQAGGAAIVGVNLGRNKETDDPAEDYARLIGTLAPLADFLTLNVSSPNTPGLRALQGREPLIDLIRRARAAMPAEKAPPLLLKIAPDLTAEDESDIAAVVTAEAIDGLIVSNTTIARPESLRSGHKAETGGLSGRPLFEPSTALLGRMYKATGGRIPLVGVGGIASGRDAYAKIRAGASLVQLYTAFIYGGPPLIPAIKAELADCLKRDGFASVADAVGADHAEETGAARHAG